MDSLNIYVDENELNSLDADLDPSVLFQKSISCPVPNCIYQGTLGNYSKLKRCWKDLHERISVMDRCIHCSKIFKNGKSELKRHLVRFIKPYLETLQRL